jgi:hypothetical protein
LDTHRGENVEGIDPKEKTAALDQTFALSIGKDGLVYHTDRYRTKFRWWVPRANCGYSIDTPDIDLECDCMKSNPTGTASRCGAMCAGAFPRIVA